MNDISLKTVDTPKEHGGVVESPVTETNAENEVDPLALDDAEVDKNKEPALQETAVEKVEEEKAGNCDDNAKEQNFSESQNGTCDNIVKIESENVTEELKQVEVETPNAPEIIENQEDNEPKPPVVEDTPAPESKPPSPEVIQPIAEEIQPKTPEEPVVLKSEPALSHPEPVASNTEPIASKSEPIVSNPDPIPSLPESIAFKEDQKVPNPEPIAFKPEPLISKPGPIVVQSEPITLPSNSIVAKELILPKNEPSFPKTNLIPPPFPQKEPSPPKEVPIEVRKQESVCTDVEMTEVVPVEEKPEPKVEKPKMPMNGDIAKEEQATKRRASEEVETESPLKKLCQEVEKTFPHHDTMISNYIQTATKNNIDEIQRHTEQLLSEIQTLRELAQKKEHEWNNILHLKKVKEEILLRLLRRKQVLSFEKSVENGSDRTDPFDYLNQAKSLAIDKSDEISGLALKQPGSSISPMMAPVMPVTTHFNPMAGLPPPYDKAAHMQPMPKPVFPQPMMMPGHMPGFPRDMNGQLPTSFGLPMGRQGPTKDVKSIIADHRQRNPEVTPRRGRRMKSLLNPNMMNAPRPIAPKIDSMNNINNLNNLNMLFNNLDMNHKAMLERLQQIQAGGLPNGVSFKDVLVQFANMQQTNSGLHPRPPETVTNRPEHRPEGRRRQERPHEEVHVPKQVERHASPSPRLPPPPPYPEISLLPVTTNSETSTQNSLLHGILTKQACPATQSYSPTLAKLLMSPERKQSAPTLPTFGQAKNCGEITITPVQPAPPEPAQEKTEEVVQLDDEESPASEGEASGSPSGSGSGRLVIDEGGGAGAAPEEPPEPDEEAPTCQGCRRRDAQFVCAGCANQWYCSRDCQVAAWDEHSEMCSG